MSVAIQNASELAGEGAAVQTDGSLFHHAAFCRIGLPMATPTTPGWQRSAGLDAIVMDAPATEANGAPGATSAGLPSGKFLRLLLVHIFTVALRVDSPVVKLGENPTELADAIDPGIRGPLLREMEEQLARLLGAKITVATAGGPALSLFDARGRARADGGEWRPSVRLNARFHASLAQHGVRLDPRVVTTLEDSTLALDAYFFFAGVRPPDVGAAPVQHGWDDLQARFAPGGETPEEFRSAFEQALLLVCGADPTLGFFTNETGVTVRTVPARPVPMAAPAPPPPVPMATPQPEMPVVAAAPEQPAPAASRPQPITRMAPRPAPPEAAPQPVREDPPRRMAPPPVAAVAPEANFSGNAPRDRVSLKHHQTGLTQVIWLMRSDGRDDVSIEVTPGRRYDPDLMTVLALEPMVLQIRGGLNAGEFERVSAWATANRDLIDDFWEGDVEGEEEIGRRVKKVPAPGWR